MAAGLPTSLQDSWRPCWKQWKKRQKRESSARTDDVVVAPLCNSSKCHHVAPDLGSRNRVFLLCLSTLLGLLQCSEATGDCDDVNIGDLIVVDNPVRVQKLANTKVTSLRILEERHLGSLTCHVLRSEETQEQFQHFVANSSTVFSKRPGAYDPHIFGKKTSRILTCDVFLRDDDFPDAAVDLEIVLILQPLTGRNGLNTCDVPTVARQTVRIEFQDSRGRPITTSTTRRPGGGGRRPTRYPNAFGDRRTTAPPVTTVTRSPPGRGRPRPTRPRKPQRPSKDRNGNRGGNRNGNRGGNRNGDKNGNKGGDGNRNGGNRDHNRGGSSSKGGDREEDSNDGDSGRNSGNREGSEGGNGDNNRNKGDDGSRGDSEGSNGGRGGDRESERDPDRNGGTSAGGSQEEDSSDGDRNTGSRGSGGRGDSASGGGRGDAGTGSDRDSNNGSKDDGDRSQNGGSGSSNRDRDHSYSDSNGDDSGEGGKDGRAPGGGSRGGSDGSDGSATEENSRGSGSRGGVEDDSSAGGDNNDGGGGRSNSPVEPSDSSEGGRNSERGSEEGAAEGEVTESSRDSGDGNGGNGAGADRDGGFGIDDGLLLNGEGGDDEDTFGDGGLVGGTVDRSDEEDDEDYYVDYNSFNIDVDDTNGRRTTRVPRIIPGFTTDETRRDNDDGGSSDGGGGDGDLVDDRILVNEVPALSPSDNATTVTLSTQDPPGDDDGGTSLAQRNASLFWSILAICACLLVVVVALLFYFCCPGACSCCGECDNRDKKLKGLRASSDGSSGRSSEVTFVTVRDADGRAINANGDAVKAYPVMNANGGITSAEALADLEERRRRRGNHVDPIESERNGGLMGRYFSGRSGLFGRRRHGDDDQMYRRSGGHEKNNDPYHRGRRESNGGGWDELENGDRVVLVRERPRSSPVPYRVLRALTPRSFTANGQNGNSNRRPGYGRQDSRTSRVFQIVKDGFERRRSGHSRRDVQVLSLDNNGQISETRMDGGNLGVQVLTLDHGTTVDMDADVDGRRRDGSNVQVLNLEEHQTYVKEGDAEVLRLGTGDDGEGDGARERPGTIDLDQPTTEQVQIQLQDFDEQQRHLREIAAASSSPFDALTRPHHDARGVGVQDGDDEYLSNFSNNGNNASMSESKVAQTDVTSFVRNKKIQTIRIDESDSDDDPDIANQSLNQSMLTSGDARAFGLQSFNEPGFINVAMGSLVRDDLRNKSRMSMATEASSTDLDRSSRSTLIPKGTYQHYSRPTEGDIAEEGNSGGRSRGPSTIPPEGRHFSIRQRAHNYYDGSNRSRSPSSPPRVNETKTSLMRRRTTVAPPRGLAGAKGYSDPINVARTRKRTQRNLELSKRISASTGTINEASAATSGQQLAGGQPRRLSRRVSTPE